MKRILVPLFLIFLAVSCTPAQSEPAATAARSIAPASSLASTIVDATPITQTIIPTVIESPEVKPVSLPDLSELEGLKIYYLTDEGIRYLFFRCGGLENGCIEDKEFINFDQISTFNEIVCVSISPGLDQMTFSSRDYSPSGSTDFYAYDFETGKTYRLTEIPDYYECGAWSPDGQHIAVMAYRVAGGDSYIETINPSGCCQQIIPRQGKYDTNPVWSPDGEKIAFASGEGEIYHLFVYDLENHEVSALVPDFSFGYEPVLDWSPDGSKIAVLAYFEDDTDICIVDIAVNDSFCLGDTAYTESGPSWSRNSEQLIFAAFDKEAKTHEIYRINADGTDKTRIPVSGRYGPFWLGNEDFFLCKYSIPNEWRFQIWISATDGSWQNRLTPEGAVNYIIKITYP